ncbi:hypothetical protein VNO78_19697 [Psophocarpus tetragonolobus]|uniref:Uncharacterized protein n=1 Tax=Psophocarpus tetragonolobus TaxID=3891 RepID=A0AAN9XGU2_PSOTE
MLHNWFERKTFPGPSHERQALVLSPRSKNSTEDMAARSNSFLLRVAQWEVVLKGGWGGLGLGWGCQSRMSRGEEKRDDSVVRIEPAISGGGRWKVEGGE